MNQIKLIAKPRPDSPCRVMVAPGPGRDLLAEERDIPTPRQTEVLIRVEACGVCRTDLHPRDGRRVGRRFRSGGAVICGGIHMSDIPAFPYADLWGERLIRSVANLTRSDGVEFLSLADAAGVHAQVVRYPLSRANEALEDLRRGVINGTAVLDCS